jgi:hypothetical protein
MTPDPISLDLKMVLRRLRLSRVLDTLPDAHQSRLPLGGRRPRQPRIGLRLRFSQAPSLCLRVLRPHGPQFVAVTSAAISLAGPDALRPHPSAVLAPS